MAHLPRNILLLSSHARFLNVAILYNCVVFATFLLIYSLIDFERHFDSRSPVTSERKLYFAVLTHTNGGANDIVPKTDIGCMLQSAHVAMSWLQLVFALMA